MEAFEICTEWDTKASDAAAKRIPTTEGTIDIFTSNRATSEQIQAHCDLVWSTSTFGADTPKHCSKFGTAPIDDQTLEGLRNGRQLKHVMMGKKLWDSLSSTFKIVISGSKIDFMRGQEYDGPLLWDFIRRRINPTITVGASKLKDMMDA